jgi:hypothetical protein
LAHLLCCVSLLCQHQECKENFRPHPCPSRSRSDLAHSLIPSLLYSMTVPSVTTGQPARPSPPGPPNRTLEQIPLVPVFSLCLSQKAVTKAICLLPFLFSVLLPTIL